MPSLSESNGNGHGTDDEKNNITESPDSLSDAGDDDRSSDVEPVRPAARPDGLGHDITGLHHHDTHSDDDGAGTDEGEEEIGSGDEEDSEEDEDEDEEDEEPALKYERLGGITHQLLQKDSASAIAYANQRIVSYPLCRLCTEVDRVQVLGTHGGMLHILTLTGELVKSFQPHSASVTDIAIDSTGDWVATASLDGELARVSVFTLQRLMKPSQGRWYSTPSRPPSPIPST